MKKAKAKKPAKRKPRAVTKRLAPAPAPTPIPQPTVAELLEVSRLAHTRAAQLRRAKDPLAAQELALAAAMRSQAHATDPQHSDLAWQGKMAGEKTHEQMHHELTSFYSTKGVL